MSTIEQTTEERQALAERWGVPVAALDPDVLEAVIWEAVRDDMTQVEGLIRLYLIVDARRAVAFYANVKTALQVAKLADDGVVQIPTSKPGTGWPA